MNQQNSNSHSGNLSALDGESNAAAQKLGFKHWRLLIDADNIAWLTLDRQEAKINSLDHIVFNELSKAVLFIMQHKPLGVVIASAKKNGFIAGADISQFTHVDTVDRAFAIMEQAQTVLKQLADLPMSTVALIHGFCLGGGLELALACRFRIALDSTKTSIGLPEVHLGLHPGWGGTVRLPRLIGIKQAMRMMLTGSSISAKQALAWQVVDEIAPSISLMQEKAKQLILHDRTEKQNTQKSHVFRYQHFWQRVWRSAIFYFQLQQRINKRHYPAPYAIVDLWRQDGALQDSAFLHEAKSIAGLMVSYTGQQLIRLFLLRGKMKALANGVAMNAADKHLHVIGCGTVGSSLIKLAAIAGFKVTVQDNTIDALVRLKKRLYKELALTLNHPDELAAVYNRVSVDPQGTLGCHADLFVEATGDDITNTQTLLKHIQLHQQNKQALLFSTNASIPLSELTQGLPNPAAVLALQGMPSLTDMNVWGVAARDTVKTPSLIPEAAAFINALGCLPIKVSSQQAHLFLRVVWPYLFEAMYLVDEKYSVQEVDQAAQHFGMAIGPLALADQIGLDRCARLAQVHQQNRPACYPIPTILQQKLALGELGCKKSQGFYRYPQLTKPSNAIASTQHTAEIIFRLIPAFVNAAVAATDSVENVDFLDAALVYAAGFPACRGGPLAYAKHYGIQQFMAILAKLAARHGARYQAATAWQTLIGKNCYD